MQRSLHAPVRKEDARAAADRYHHEERVRFTRHVEPVRFGPEHREILHSVRIVPATYHYRRTVFYETYAWAPPRYVYTMYPRYGLYDATFLAFMVDHAAERQYALMYYNHRNDEAFVQWRQQMDSMAADNAELKARLATMDQEVVKLQGTPPNPNYVPQDVQDVALAPDVVEKMAQPQQ